MANDNEDKQELTGLGYRINERLSKKYTKKREENLLDLLAIPNLKDTLNELSKRLGIKRLASAPSGDFIDYYIVDCILDSSAYGKTGSSEDFTLFLATYRQFNEELTSLLKDYKLHPKTKNLIKGYIVADKVDESLSEEPFVSVFIDNKTKVLRLELSPKIKQTELTSILGDIFRAWNRSRTKPANNTVSGSVKIDSELAVFKNETTLAQAVREHKKDGNYELWKKRMQRQEKRQKKILGDTKT